MRFITDITEGRYLDTIEKSELEKSAQIAKCIDIKMELLPLIQTMINDKKKGSEIKESLLQHRLLVHSLFYSKNHVLGELSRIIDELEYQTRIQEHACQQYRVIRGGK